jgi:uncharacterized protein (DUF1778 family)
MRKKHAGGRPPKPPGEKYKTPARQLGRVSDEDWALLQQAAAASGEESFTAWAVAILIRNAKRQLNKSI